MFLEGSRLRNLNKISDITGQNSYTNETTHLQYVLVHFVVRLFLGGNGIGHNDKLSNGFLLVPGGKYPIPGKTTEIPLFILLMMMIYLLTLTSTQG